MKLPKVALLSVLFSAAACQISQAGFTTNDLYLGFTQPSAQSDYIIDLGQPTAVGVGGSSVVDLSASFSSSTFNSVFAGGPNGVVVAVVGGNNVFGSFGVFATQLRTSGPGNPPVAGSAVTATHSTSQMSGGASQVASILSSTIGGLPAAGNSLVDSTKSYTAVVNTTGLQNNFIGKTGVIPFGTLDSSAILYLDLYRATVSTAYTYLGFFTINLSGSTPKLTFTPSAANGGTVPPSPVTLTIGWANGQSSISFASSNSVTYKLFFTNATGLGSPIASWPSLPDTIVGDGTVKSFTDTTADPVRFYQVQER